MIIGWNKKLINIYLKNIIKEINISFVCIGIKIIKNKGIFLIGRNSNDIMILKNDDYKYIQTIENAHIHFINGFIDINIKIILKIRKIIILFFIVKKLFKEYYLFPKIYIFHFYINNLFFHIFKR